MTIFVTAGVLSNKLNFIINITITKEFLPDRHSRIKYVASYNTF